MKPLTPNQYVSLAIWAALIGSIVSAFIGWYSAANALELCERDRALHITELTKRQAKTDSLLMAERKMNQLKVDSYRSAIDAFSFNEDFVNQEALRIYVLKLDSIDHE